MTHAINDATDGQERLPRVNLVGRFPEGAADVRALSWSAIGHTIE